MNTVPDTAHADDGIQVIWVISMGKRTSISIDNVLFDALREREGSHEAAAQWIRASIPRIEQLRSAEDPLVALKRAGLSRLVQRMVLTDVLASLKATPGLQNLPQPAAASSSREALPAQHAAAARPLGLRNRLALRRRRPQR